MTEDKQQIGSAIEIARQIRQAIKSELQLTASAGVSINKFVAKIASDMNKPDGLTFIAPMQVEEFMEKLPVEKFYGVGRVTADKMKKMNLFTGADLKKLTEDELTRYFGKAGRFYYGIVRGIDERAVQADREPKSLAAEDTFAYDLVSIDDMNAELDKIALTVCERLQKYGFRGRTITLKIKYSDFKQITRSLSFQHPVSDLETISSTSKQLLSATDLTDKKIRLLGISLSNFKTQAIDNRKAGSGQLSLFEF